MNIFVLGWYGHQNIGDESYKLSFKSVWPEHTFTFDDKQPTNAKYDLCIIGGGDVIREENVKKALDIGCPVIAISVTITNQSLCNDLHLLDHIYVRDEKSVQVLKDFSYDNVTYIPDISLILTGNFQKGREIIESVFKKNDLELYESVYAIVVNAHLLASHRHKAYDYLAFHKMIEDFSDLVDNTDSSFIFIPFSTKTPWDDRITNGLVNANAKFHSKNCVIMDDDLSVYDVINIITASNRLITTRFHGLIFGLATNTPTTTISFHDKISGFCETIGQNYIDFYNLNIKDLTNQVKNSTTNGKINIQQIKKDYLEKVHLLRG